MSSQPNPAVDYAEAVGRVSALQSAQRPKLSPEAVVRLLTHGRAADHAIVFVHGYTSGPIQFQALGEIFFDLGYNVLIPPLPHHGLPDRSSNEHARLTAEELVAYCHSVLDIAAGLGRHTTVAGLSAGGLIAAWAAQHRPDVHIAVPIAPTFGYRVIPEALTVPLSGVLGCMPNFYTWWDRLPESDPRAGYMYPSFASHTLAQLMRLGREVEAAARKRKPAAGRIILVLNESDRSVSNTAARRIADLWERKGADVTIHAFGARLGLPHDLIDPRQPRQQIAAVYPILTSLIAGAHATAHSQESAADHRI